MSRTVTARYSDPLEVVWIETARRLGMRLVRSGEVYASWDGAGTLTLSTPDAFDADDSLAQLLLHEICHALVEGPQGVASPDWGLDNQSERDVVREHACQRLQCALASVWGLRAFFGSTTDFRAYYDALPSDPLSTEESPGDPAVEFALQGARRAAEPPWAEALRAAFEATVVIVRATRPFAADDLLYAKDGEAPGSLKA
jgi:hypothetical protein